MTANVVDVEPQRDGTRALYIHYVPNNRRKRNRCDSRVATCRIPRTVSSQDRDSECSPCFVASLSTRGEPFRWLLPLPCPPASPSLGEGLLGGLREGRAAGVNAEVCETG